MRNYDQPKCIESNEKKNCVTASKNLSYAHIRTVQIAEHADCDKKLSCRRKQKTEPNNYNNNSTNNKKKSDKKLLGRRSFCLGFSKRASIWGVSSQTTFCFIIFFFALNRFILPFSICGFFIQLFRTRTLRLILIVS